ncbi:MAG: sulfatase family protein [Cyclobacteriaceae bacterium]
MSRPAYILCLFVLLQVGCSPTENSQPPPRPNILIAIADDASFPHMGAYGCTWVKTPAFDHVAANGILFTNAYTPNAKCAPSRACILTGRNSWQLEEGANHWGYWPEKFKSYIEVLGENDYHVGYTRKGWLPGIFRGEPRELTGKAYNERTLTPPTNGISPIDYAGNFAAFLEDKPDDQPFHFWYGSIEPHRVYQYGSGEELGGKSTDDLDRVPGFWPDNDTVRNDLLDYAYEIEYFDSHLQMMLDLLREKGELENTIVIVTADNGMPFPRVKGQAYEYSNHLPLAIMWPDGIKQPGREVADLISFIDFAPTLMDLIGIDPEETNMQPIQGASFSDLLNDEQSKARDFVLIGKERHDVGRPDDQGYPIRGIVKDGYLYVQNFETDRWPSGNPETGYLNCDGSPTKTECLKAHHQNGTKHYWSLAFGKRSPEELFQISKDRECLVNLADEEDHQSVKEELKNLMIAELTKQADPRILGNGHIFDQYVYADVKTHDFYNRYFAGEALEAGWVNQSDFEDKIPPSTVDSP